MYHETDIDESPTSGAAQTDNIIDQYSSSNLPLHVITPETVRFHPKLQARKMSNRDQHKGKSRVLTYTPKKLIIKDEKKATH